MSSVGQVADELSPVLLLLFIKVRKISRRLQRKTDDDGAASLNRGTTRRSDEGEEGKVRGNQESVESKDKKRNT